MQLLKGLVLWFAAFGVAIVLVLSIYPRILTGSYADITIDRVSVSDYGQYNVTYSTRLAARTSLVEKFTPVTNAMGAVAANSGYLGWPRRGSVDVSLMLDPEDLAAGRRREPRPDRMLVHEGQTCRLTPGKRLYFYNFKAADGVTYCGYVEAKIYSDPERMIAWPW